MVNARVDGYLDTLEDRAIRDAKASAEAVGVPVGIYAVLWDKESDPADRLRVASVLVGDLIRNAVPIESVVHITISVAVMLGHQYRGNPD